MSIESNIYAEYFSCAGGKSVRVLRWLLENKDEFSQIEGTLDEIALQTGVTKNTVNSIFQKLYAEGFLERIQNGYYQINKI